MSLGHTGTCRKVAEDDHIVIYSYAGENWYDGGKSKCGDSQLQDGAACDYADPLPILLGYGRSAEPGLWLGDVVGVSDEISSAYTPVKEIHLDW